MSSEQKISKVRLRNYQKVHTLQNGEIYERKTTFRIGELAKLFDIGVDSIGIMKRSVSYVPKRDPINNYRLYDRGCQKTDNDPQAVRSESDNRADPRL